MESNKILDSVSYLNFINQINAIAKELLYGLNGYCYLKSVNAINLKNSTIEKFKFEANKIKNSLNFSDSSNYIDLKFNDFINIVQKHYDNELLVWAQDVFDELSQNYLFEVSLDKSKAKEIYTSLLNLILWLAKIKKLSKTQVLQMQNKYKTLFEESLNSDDFSYIYQNKELKTEPDDFLNLWNLILNDYKEFIQIDFKENAQILSFEDVKYFENIKSKLKTYKKQEILDEILLISSAFGYFKINNNSEKFDLIKALNNDFILFLEKNKSIEEKDKINLIKRRITLFKERKNKSCSYFTTQFSHSLNE